MAMEYYDEDEAFDDPIEGYCVRCRESVEMEEPQAVWTRKGMPATRGICPICGGTVFRMGKTELHAGSQRPEPIELGDSAKRNRPKLPRDTVYVIYAQADEAIARQIAADLEKSGITPWIHEHEDDDVAWAGGVHPALKECNRMLFVLSPDSHATNTLEESWRFFKSQRKPIVIAQVENTTPPDDIRRSPRFDFTSNYRRAFRDMLHALG